jgi:hypothetical protein
MIRIACFCLIAFFSLIEAKVSIFAHYFGQPEFIKYQYLFFKQNLVDEFEFVVFEDSNNPKVSEAIRKECLKYGVKYVQIPRSVFERPKLPIRDKYVTLKSPSFQCALATQYIYDNYVIPSENICLILDNDIFLLSEFNVENYLGEYAFAYPRESRRDGDRSIFYMLPNFVIFNPSIMPEKERLNFNMGSVLGMRTDSGGFSYFYLRDYDHLGAKIVKYYLWNTTTDLKERFSKQCPLMFSSKEWSSHFFLEKDTFLHIRMGSNWSHHPNYGQMKKEISLLFDSLLETVYEP